MLAISSMACLGAQAPAISVQPSPATRHQMIVKLTDCMRKRMSADRVVSYSEAGKTCREQLRKQRDPAAPNTLVATGSIPKP
jgi:hypothetical protein